MNHGRWLCAVDPVPDRPPRFEQARGFRLQSGTLAPVRRRARDEAGLALPEPLEDGAEALALAGVVDAPRYRDLREHGQQDEEPTGNAEVAGDPVALGRRGLAADLHQEVAPRLEPVLNGRVQVGRLPRQEQIRNVKKGMAWSADVEKRGL